MKTLIVFRHGQEEMGIHLSQKGREQVIQTLKKLGDCLNGDSYLILSSTAHRALETAEVIAEKLYSQVERHDVLWSGGGGKGGHTKEDFQKVLDIILTHPNQADVVILVTHYEYVEDFPNFFAQRQLNVPMHASVIDKGTAWLIDCQEKTMVHVK